MPLNRLEFETPIVFVYIDKVAHCFLFACQYFFVAKAIKEKNIIVTNISLLFFIFLFAVLTEWLQSFTSYRSFELFDIFADTFGALIGYFLYCYGNEIYKYANRI